MKLVKCRQCEKETTRYDRDGSLFCNQGCYFKWKKTNPNKKAYKTKVLISGYYYLYRPDHPNAIKGGRYIAEHRYVAEQKAGRYLTNREIAHHINGNRKDNRPENIEILTISEHNKLTYQNRQKDKYGKLK